LFDNHYESFFYNHAMNLAKAGEHDEAINYTKRRHHENQHVHNALGDMLRLFQSKNDLNNCRKIIDYYKTNKTKNLPFQAFADYYTKKGNIDKALKNINRISSLPIKALSLLKLEETHPSGNDRFLNAALKLIHTHFYKNSENNWSIVGHAAYEIYKLKGQKYSNAFIGKYFDKHDHKAEIGHKRIIKSLFSENKARDVLTYMDNLGHPPKAGRYIISIAKLRLKLALQIPDMDVAQMNPVLYRYVIFEAIKHNYPEKDVLGAILRNYPGNNNILVKSELMQITARMASLNSGHKAAETLFNDTAHPLLKARWLIGVAQKNQTDEIHNGLRYNLYL